MSRWQQGNIWLHKSTRTLPVIAVSGRYAGKLKTRKAHLRLTLGFRHPELDLTYSGRFGRLRGSVGEPLGSRGKIARTWGDRTGRNHWLAATKHKL